MARLAPIVAAYPAGADFDGLMGSGGGVSDGAGG